MGVTNPEVLRPEADIVALKNGDVAPLFTNALIGEVNAFDAEAIRAAGRSLRCHKAALAMMIAVPVAAPPSPVRP